MNKNLSKYFYSAGLAAISAGLLLSNAHAQLAPPAMGEETKGVPAQIEDQSGNLQTVEAEEIKGDVKAGVKEDEQKKSVFSALGTTKITESKRESGQVYRIELEHSGGSKQYIEETDSDGKIQSTSNDIEETPNLPKWKIGSW